MPAALSTAKRKFHRILDSISNTSSTSLIPHLEEHNASSTTLPATLDPPTKKPRVQRPKSAYIPASRRTSESAKIIASRKTTAAAVQTTPTTMNGERKAPNFVPWDRSQFLERLKTYRHIDKWMAKPETISEVEWAKRGWSCVGKERVGCFGGCRKEVVIKLETPLEDREGEQKRGTSSEEEDEDDWREKAQEHLVEKYAEMIITAHDGGCLWRRRGCDDTIYRLPLAQQATALDNLRQRYNSLNAMASDLPSNLSIPEKSELSEKCEYVLALLCERATKPADPSTDITTSEPTPSLNEAAWTLALFGWQAEESHISGLATCHACFRRLGLWLFKPSAGASSESSMDRLDVVGEHRDYCPWINALSQNGNTSRHTSLEGLAGWEILLRVVNANTRYWKEETERLSVSVAREGDNAASEVNSIATSASAVEDKAARDEKDTERWAKLKRLKQVFRVKINKGGRGVGEKRKTVVG